MTREISLKQRGLIAQKIRDDFWHFQEITQYEGEDQCIHYLYALFFQVYDLHLKERYLTVMSSFRYIPLVHPATCRKYIDRAVKMGFLEVSESPTDKRKKWIQPGPKLFSFIEREIEREMRGIRAVLDQD